MTEIDLALIGGRVRTLDPDRPSRDRGRRRRRAIAASATTPRCASCAGARTEVVDLDGAAVVPGSPTATCTRSSARWTRAAPT